MNKWWLLGPIAGILGGHSKRHREEDKQHKELLQASRPVDTRLSPELQDAGARLDPKPEAELRKMGYDDADIERLRAMGGVS
jgi:hypothetical protein